MDLVSYTKKEEIANAITYVIGIALSIIGLIYMLDSSIEHGNTSHIIGSVIFGTTLILMYTSSTLYHSSQSKNLKIKLRKLDHISIYFLIAGSYTPLTLITLKDTAWGWSIFRVIWILAIFGTIYKLTPLNRFKKLSLILYLGMGWLGILATKPMIQLLDTNGLYLLFTGGIAYTLGYLCL